MLRRLSESTTGTGGQQRPREAIGGQRRPTKALGHAALITLLDTLFFSLVFFEGGMGSGCICFMTPSGAKCGMMDTGIITSKELVRPLCFDAARPLV